MSAVFLVVNREAIIAGLVKRRYVRTGIKVLAAVTFSEHQNTCRNCGAIIKPREDYLYVAWDSCGSPALRFCEKCCDLFVA